MSPLLLEGHIETEEQSELRALAHRVEQLEDRTQELGEQLKSVVQMAALLKRQLAPVFTGKQTEPVPSSANDAVEKWKNRFGPIGARLVEILELGPSTRNKLRPALQCGWSTLDALLKKFRDVGLIEKDGDSYKLRV